MDQRGTVLRTLLRQRHWQKYPTFCEEYDKAARSINADLAATWPSRPQLQRWLSGTTKTLPYPDHCRVLETMFPGWTAEQLFQQAEPDAVQAIEGRQIMARVAFPDPVASLPAVLDLSAVYPTRSDFLSALPFQKLFVGASRIRLSGLSLNALTQHYPDSSLIASLRDGARYQCLFLDPAGEAIGRRESEEGQQPGHLRKLTDLNLDVMRGIRSRLPDEYAQGLEIGVLDETIRFNIVLVDEHLCAFQPYLPQSRGLEAPTFVVDNSDGSGPLFLLFDGIFESLWKQRKSA